MLKWYIHLNINTFFDDALWFLLYHIMSKSLELFTEIKNII